MSSRAGLGQGLSNLTQVIEKLIGAQLTFGEEVQKLVGGSGDAMTGLLRDTFRTKLKLPGMSSCCDIPEPCRSTARAPAAAGSPERTWQMEVDQFGEALKGAVDPSVRYYAGLLKLSTDYIQSLGTLISTAGSLSSEPAIRWSVPAGSAVPQLASRTIPFVVRRLPDDAAQTATDSRATSG